MNKLKFISLMIIFVLGAAVVTAQDSEANVAITLERTPCFGTCPAYTVTIMDDGTVIYEGQNFVETMGEQTSEIDPETVASMVEAFTNAGYFEWDEAYDTQTVSDLPTVTTSVTRDGETHRIVRYTGDSSAPLALPYLEWWIDVMTNTQLWTGVQSDIANIATGGNTPIITLQRDACFGFCPVYSVALFEDGTVVFTGIANVDTLGVEVFETDAIAITSIAQRAQSFGYFGWQERYDQQVMTDQATVTTSISWEDQYNRIVRYDGDPNAPVGLVWVEDIIDQTVTDLIGQ
jgi:hypothetical protein